MKHLMTVNICMAPLPISQDRFKRIGYLSPETRPKSTAKTPVRRDQFEPSQSSAMISASA
jgi:hypothetical protein